MDDAIAATTAGGASFSTSTVVGRAARTAAAVAPSTSDPTAAVLANLGAGTAAQLNTSALAVWEYAEGGQTLGAIIDTLATVFAAERAVVEHDVLRAAEQLVSLGYLVSGDAGNGEVDLAAHLDGDRPPCAHGELTEPDDDGRRRVTVPASPCQHSIDELGWHATTTIQVGAIDLGVRTNSEWATEQVRRTFAPRAVDDASTPPNYSVVLAPAGTDPEPPHHRCGLFHGHRWISIDTDPDGLLALLRAHLLAWSPTPLGCIRLDMVAVHGDTGIVLTPAPPDPVATAVAATASGRQWPIASWPTTVDTRTRALVRSADVSARQRLAPSAAPIVAVVVTGDDVARLEPAAALAALATRLRLAPDDDAETVLDTAAELVDHLAVVRAPAADLADVVAGLARRRQPM
jgi:hypothetical protein